MKQSEKKDIVLRYLYEERDNNKYFNILEILDSNSIESNHNEVARIAKDLEDDKLIDLKDLSSILKKGKITSKGVDYCEKTSYSQEEKSVLNMANIHNSTIVINSNHVIINQSNAEKANELLEEIKKELEIDQKFNPSERTEIFEALHEIQLSIKNQNPPKSAIRGLISLLGDGSSITGLVMSLAKLFS